MPESTQWRLKTVETWLTLFCQDVSFSVVHSITHTGELILLEGVNLMFLV